MGVLSFGRHPDGSGYYAEHRAVGVSAVRFLSLTRERRGVRGTPHRNHRTVGPMGNPRVCLPPIRGGSVIYRGVGHLLCAFSGAASATVVRQSRLFRRSLRLPLGSASFMVIVIQPRGGVKGYWNQWQLPFEPRPSMRRAYLHGLSWSRHSDGFPQIDISHHKVSSARWSTSTARLLGTIYLTFSIKSPVPACRVGIVFCIKTEANHLMA